MVFVNPHFLGLLESILGPDCGVLELVRLHGTVPCIDCNTGTASWELDNHFSVVEAEKGVSDRTPDPRNKFSAPCWPPETMIPSLKSSRLAEFESVRCSVANNKIQDFDR